LQRLPDRRKIVNQFPNSSILSRLQQPPPTRNRIIRTPPNLNSLPPLLLLEERDEFLRFDVLVVGVGSGGDEAHDVFGHGDGEEFGERGAGDGGEEEGTAGLEEGRDEKGGKRGRGM
jgi:hypothetical protein